ncbi:uracil DNA N-glycosylase Thp1 [Coemansia sp. RSA 2336]|nr:uracil DNA N-glycosylase Thp1 [Coemansia sp. RSA 2336]
MPKASTSDRSSKVPKPSPQKQQRRQQPTAQEISQLAPIPETLRPGFDVLFVGINPGVISGLKQLHFGNPRNFFWKGLYQSELIPEPIPPEDGHRLSSEWNMSIVNLVQRTTPSTSDLSRQEMRAAVPELCRKISSNPPKIVCFVGMGIYEAFASQRKVALGLQDVVYDLSAPLDQQAPPLRSQSALAPDTPWCYLFVMPSTSGRTTTYQNPEKLQYFRQLKCRLQISGRAGTAGAVKVF